MKLGDRIRELNQKRFMTDPDWMENNINDLSNEQIIDLISEAGDEWIDHKVRSYQTTNSSVDPDWDK